MTFELGNITLTYKFMEMLNWAEELFGKRLENWTYIGIEFRQDGPYINYYPNNKVSIVLSSGCSNTFPIHPQLYYQLSHETCHLLYPTGKKDANNLNEGISTYFSKIFIEKEYPGNNYAMDNIKKSKYYEPFLLVEKLLREDKDAVKKIREINSNISSLTFEELNTLNFNLTEVEMKKLVEKFI